MTKLSKETLTEEYRKCLLNPETNLHKAFTLAWKNLVYLALDDDPQEKEPLNLGKEAKKFFEGERFLDLAVDQDRAEEQLLKVVHEYIDWTSLAETYLSSLEKNSG